MLATEDRTGHTVFQNTIDQGHELHLVENSAKVLTIYAAQAPDILFLDAHLLQNKEASILRQLFQIDPGAYIIIISAPDKEEHLSKALSLGARGFVGKPFTAVEISEYVHTSPYIHRKQIRQNPCPKVA
jgi:two-component system chemotaxis response regulator CheY